MLIFKLHNLHNPERVSYFPVGQSAPSLSPFIAICRILALPHIRRMRTYQSTLNDLERLNQLTKIGRNCSFPVDSPLPEVICKSYSLQHRPCSKTLRRKRDPKQRWNYVSASVGSEIPFPAACPEPLWPRQPDPSFRHAALELPQAGITPPTPLPTLWKVSATARMGRRGDKPAGSTTLLCLPRRQPFFKAGMQWVRLPAEETATMIGRKELGNSWPQVLPWAQIKWEAVDIVNTEKVMRKKQQSGSPEYQINLLYERFIVIEDFGVFACSRNTVCPAPPPLAGYHQPQATKGRMMWC